MKTATTVPGARCFPQYALNVAEIPRYPLSHVATSQSTVAIASEKQELADKELVRRVIYRPVQPGLYMPKKPLITPGIFVTDMEGINGYQTNRQKGR